MSRFNCRCGLLVSVFLGSTGCRDVPPSPPDEIGSCRPCHQQLVESYESTPHRHTSSAPSISSIKGDLRPGHNVLHTRLPEVWFRVEPRQDGIYQVGVDDRAGYSRAERIDIVIGSGRIGQTYLYWKNGMLFELPVSFLVANRSWINSPGYLDGRIDFDRPIVPRCLECHSTSFAFQVRMGRPSYNPAYVLGIGCSRCHGDGSEHIAWHQTHRDSAQGHAIVNPADLSRERRLDVCALCHSGIRPGKQPAFSFRPGQVLDEFLGPSQSPSTAIPDVHGDQIGLLQRTKCFQQSLELTCITCHDVHRPERDLVQMARKCLQCHDTGQHPNASRLGPRLMDDCIDCHMPSLPSRALQVRTAMGEVPIYYRSHAIAIYPDPAGPVSRSFRERSR